MIIGKVIKFAKYLISTSWIRKYKRMTHQHFGILGDRSHILDADDK